MFLILNSCLNFDRGQEYLFLYDFENKETISQDKRDETVVVLRKRLKKFGASNTKVSLNNKNQIEIKIKTVLNEERINSLVLNQGELEFWETYNGKEFSNFIMSIDNALKEEDKPSDVAFLSLITGIGYQGSPSIFVTKVEDTAKVNTYLNSTKVRSLLDSNHRYAKFLWGDSDLEGNCELFAIKSNRENIAPITANHIVEAIQNYDVIGKPCISIQMNNEGSARWERITGNAYREGKCIAIVLNDIVLTAPRVNNGAITGGRTEVTGAFALEQAQSLATILSSGQSISKLKFLTSQKIIKK